MKLLIVGGVAGGASAAARARRLDEAAEIIVFERGPDVSFANCGLPYYLGGEIKQREKLLVVTPKLLAERFRLDVRTRSNVERIDRSNKRIVVRNLATNETYSETYDKLILAPGAGPIRPPIPGVQLPGIFTLRSLEDTDAIFDASSSAKSVVLLGGGFIGLELAENFVKRKLAVTVVERNGQVLAPFDEEMTRPIQTTLGAHGVNLLLGESATSFEKTPQGLKVQLASGKSVEADFIVLGIGVRADNHLAVDAGLGVGPRGGIQVNDRMRTSDPDIFAVGDAVETTDFVFGDPTQVPLAGPANRQGRIAADNALGRDVRYRGTQGTAIVGVFDRTAAMTGASEKVLVRLGKPFRKIYIHPTHHAGYYPGAETMTLKLLFDPTSGKILGAQAVGGAGVDKRVDVLAMAIQAGMTVFDLEEAELCYAPQYGSAKDPINMAGFVAAGLLRGDHPQAGCDELADPSSNAPWLLDVRTPTEFSAGHIPGAVNIPIDELRSRLADLPKDREIVAYCKVGQRGYLATRLLRQKGFKVRNLSGGFSTYELRQT